MKSERKQQHTRNGAARYTLFRARTLFHGAASGMKTEVLRVFQPELRTRFRLPAWGVTSKVSPLLTEQQALSGGRLLKERLFSPEEIEQQRRDDTLPAILFTLICSVSCGTKEELLSMVESVRNQTYVHWELLLCADIGKLGKQTGEKTLEALQGDERIRLIPSGPEWSEAERYNAGIQSGAGDYFAIIGDRNLLHEAALYECARTIDCHHPEFLFCDEATFHLKREDAYLAHFKADFAPDSVLSCNTAGPFAVFSRDTARKTGPFRKNGKAAWFDYSLRAALSAEKIAHLPEILYFWRSAQNSDAPFLDFSEEELSHCRESIQDVLQSRGTPAQVESTPVGGAVFRLRYELKERPKISIIIPNYEHEKDLRRCVDTLCRLSTYDNYEVVIVENNSRSAEIFDAYRKLAEEYGNVSVIQYDGPFNFSAINNWAVNQVQGEYVLLLNNDVQVCSPEWIEELLMYAQRSDVGAVGAKLVFPDGSIQHGGDGVGIGGVASHLFYGFDGASAGYMGRLHYAQNLSAVTAACLLVRRAYYLEVGGMSEDLPVSYNDVDFCLKLERAGYRTVWTPFAELKHFESSSRGRDISYSQWQRFECETERFREKWQSVLEAGDPAYNPNLSPAAPNFDFKGMVRPYPARVTAHCPIEKSVTNHGDP